LRIWPTYLAGFAVTVVAVIGGCLWFDVAIPFSPTEICVHAIPGIRDILKSRDIDGIIWTLEIEVKFYVLCALSFALLHRRSPWVFAIPIVLGIFALWLCAKIPDWDAAHPNRVGLSITMLNLSQYVVYMYVGTVFHYLHLKSIKAEAAVFLIAVLFAVTCLIWHSGPYKGSVAIAWNYGFGIGVFAFAMSWPRLFKRQRVLEFFADISYPLYVVHGIAGYVLMRTLQEQRWPSSIIILVTASSAICVAWLIHRFVEIPTQALGKRLASQFERATRKGIDAPTENAPVKIAA
jgi:peptidoglycan/LPS O-acetylase OafA/YrhL